MSVGNNQIKSLLNTVNRTYQLIGPVVVKHIEGRHNQQTHARGGGGGSAGGGKPSGGGSGDVSKHAMVIAVASGSGQGSKAVKAARKEVLAEAKKQGFKSTSRNRWINEQQGLEFLDAKVGKATVAKAKASGFKPGKQHDPKIIELMARDHLAKGGNSKPAISKKAASNVVKDLPNPPGSGLYFYEKAKETEGITPEIISAAVKKLKSIGKNNVVANYATVQASLEKWFKDNKIKKANTASIMDNIFRDHSIVAQIFTMYEKKQ